MFAANESVERRHHRYSIMTDHHHSSLLLCLRAVVCVLLMNSDLMLKCSNGCWSQSNRISLTDEISLQHNRSKIFYVKYRLIYELKHNNVYIDSSTRQCQKANNCNRNNNKYESNTINNTNITHLNSHWYAFLPIEAHSSSLIVNDLALQRCLSTSEVEK